jgi:hypothetical protein
MFMLLQFGISCSCGSNCDGPRNYHIDYSSGGGFTGIESGITINSNRSVKYWKRNINSAPVITDSTELTSGQLNTFNELIKNKEVFTYKNDFKGNYTARLVIVSSESTNTISFNPAELPKDMPDVLKNIIAEIKNINSIK